MYADKTFQPYLYYSKIKNILEQIITLWRHSRYFYLFLYTLIKLNYTNSHLIIIIIIYLQYLNENALHIKKIIRKYKIKTLYGVETDF